MQCTDLYLAAVQNLIALRELGGPEHVWRLKVRLAYVYGMEVAEIAAMLRITPTEAQRLLLGPTH